MKLKSLIILALMSSPGFADVTEYVCPQPQFNSSAYHKNIIAFMVTIMGSKTASCGLYAEDINLTKDPNSVPIPHDDSSCIEIKCRAVNAKQIINNAKKIIALSNQALAEEKERSFSLITSQGEKKINKGIKQIEKILPDWENFIRKPYSDYTYQEAERFIIRSLEVRTLNQVDLLPNATIQEYKDELQKIEEAKRLAAEKKRQEDERKRRLEQQQQAQQQKLLAAKEQQEYVEEMACIWTLTFDQYPLFLPFRHSNCLWYKAGLPNMSWPFLNFIMLWMLFALIKRKKTNTGYTSDSSDGQDAKASTHEPSFFEKHNIQDNANNEEVDAIFKESIDVEDKDISDKLFPKKRQSKGDEGDKRYTEFTNENGLSYKGEVNAEGHLHGHGTFELKDGTRHVGEFINGEMHGPGKRFYSDGGSFEGVYEHGKKSGFGILKKGDFIYEGQFAEDSVEGEGKLTYLGDGPKDGVYEGSFKDSMKHGLGKYVYKDGSIYEGNWEEDKWCGQGKLLYNDDAIYEGEWKDSMKHGLGKLVYKDGGIYEGNWEENEWRQGKFTTSEGYSREGEWKDFELHGNVEVEHRSGDTYSGEYKDHTRHGLGTYTYANGNIYEGNWEKGLILNGKFTSKDGDEYVGEFTNVKRKGGHDEQFHGHGTYTKASGESYIGEFKNNKKHGKGTLQSPDGKIIFKGQWKNDKKLK